MKNKRQVMIITGATGVSGRAATRFFRDDYDLILLDLDLRKLRLLKEELAPNAAIQKFDITKTVDLVRLSSLLKEVAGFNYLLHFASFGPFNDDLAEIYKVNLIGTKNLFDYIYPFILPKGVVINISASPFLLVDIPEDILPLLHDPLRATFLQEILPLTNNALEAYSYSKYGCAHICGRNVFKWELKDARITSIFPNLKHMKECSDAHFIYDLTPSVQTSFIEIETLLTAVRAIILDEDKTFVGQNITINDDGKIIPLPLK